MEITLEAIISLIGILTGGGVGSFFTWRYFKRKAKADAESAEAEAEQKEAEAEKARIEANRQFQEMYKTMFNDIKENYDEKQSIIDELRRDRDHYKSEAEEYHTQIEKISKQFLDYKLENERNMIEMKRDIARNGRMVESMRPFMCGLAKDCHKFVPVTISATGELEKTVRPKAKKQSDIEPIDQKDM